MDGLLQDEIAVSQPPRKRDFSLSERTREHSCRLHCCQAILSFHLLNYQRIVGLKANLLIACQISKQPKAWLYSTYLDRMSIFAILQITGINW